MTAAHVVGAGLSGLAAAWRLRDAGWDVTVFDRAAGPGGLVGTLDTPFGRVERAANAFVWTETTARWFASLDLPPAFADDRSRRRYIYRGRPRRWPLTPLETTTMAARAGAHWVTGRARPRDTDSIADWSDRVFGPAATSWLVGPALQGVYGAQPEALAARAIFSGERRPRGRKLAATAAGMGGFTRALHEKLAARGVQFCFNRSIEALEPGVPTIVATDAPHAAQLLAPHAPALAASIAAIGMTGMISATVFHHRTASDLAGFGMLFPRPSGVRALGVLFNSDIFPTGSSHRSETWIYETAAGVTPDEAAVLRQVREDRARVTGATTGPVGACVTVHASALPIYGPEVIAVRARWNELPGWLAIAGNFAGRLGVARLLDGAEAAAAKLTSAVESSHPLS